MKKIVIYLFGFFFISLTIFPQLLDQSFIAVNSTGVKEFLANHPEYDGRGTLILIIDSGVDIGIEGLKTTTTGETKPIDVQDFTGEGDFYFSEADVDSDDDTLTIYDEENSISVKVKEGYLLPNEDNIYIGAINEKHWMNSGAHTYDLDNNGETNDKFVFIVYKPKDSEDWVVYLDTSNNGLLDDEKPLKNYKINYDVFTIKTEYDEPAYTFGLNIFPEQKKVVFHYDAVAHGTHCAGIAAGNKIGNDNFYGVAPGAFLGSLKIGSSVYAGGSTTTGSMKSAYEYADKLSRELDMPVIINMSYGVGSEIEGQSEMEKYLQKLVSANPYLYISLSAGNEGPGISTVGLPSTSSYTLCSGATLAKEVGNDLYGAPINKDVILHFSSRGGEINKPDIVSPGAATSTVPYWEGYDRFWGTSMAAPYSAGVMSLLLSAMEVEYPDVKIPSRLLYKAIRESAVPIEGYDPLDQGGGLINVNNAYDLLKKYIEEDEIEKFETYTTLAFAPSTPSGDAENLYIRNGSYLQGTERFIYKVKRDFFNKSEKFFRSYNIESEADWLKTITKKTYIRNKQSAEVAVTFDKSKMSEPGLYNGVIKAYRADATMFPEFEMLATVVIPYQFTYENGYKQNWSGKLAPAEVKRYFIDIPPSATSMKIELSYDEGNYSYTWFQLHDPEGREVYSSPSLKSEDDNKQIQYMNYDFKPGVYEIDVVGYYKSTGNVQYNLAVEFQSLQIVDKNTIDNLDNVITVNNPYKDVLHYNLQGEVLGYKDDFIIKFSDKEKMTYDFKFAKGEKEKTFNLSITPEDFNKVTDFSVMILDKDGKAVSVESFGYKNLTISLYNSSEEDKEENYTLELIPAFTNEVEELNVYVHEVTTLKETEKMKITSKGNTAVDFYPSIPNDLSIEVDKEKVNSPEGKTPFGKIYFKAQNSGKVEYELPVYINF